MTNLALRLLDPKSGFIGEFTDSVHEVFSSTFEANPFRRGKHSFRMALLIAIDPFMTGVLVVESVRAGVSSAGSITFGFTPSRSQCFSLPVFPHSFAIGARKKAGANLTFRPPLGISEITADFAVAAAALGHTGVGVDCFRSQRFQRIADHPRSRHFRKHRIPLRSAASGSCGNS